MVAKTKKARTRRPPPPRATPPEETAAWARVRFKVLLGVRGRHGVRRGGPAPLEPVTALVFAERLEALIRAVHAPERLAQRLARRMQAAKGKAARGSRDDLVARLLRPTMDTPANPAREAMKQLAPYTDEADRYFSSA